jgi:hypothetical protein
LLNFREVRDRLAVFRFCSQILQSNSLRVTFMSTVSTKKMSTSTGHTGAWIAQTYVSFFISITATILGLVYMPADTWQKGYIGMGLLFSVASTASLSKTIRDVEESKTMLSRIDEAKLERLLAEYDPFKQ